MELMIIKSYDPALPIEVSVMDVKVSAGLSPDPSSTNTANTEPAYEDANVVGEPA
ncbi:UNVERIFIED_CONTAM: hypothetical protein Slati_0117000 [Sesamum latifolium]|uniref:Uncharacterized protein n=1 Tax=Sesamum latifolium TaxID=2727402 RepID=A0AAW2Y934_9LAMI